MAIPPFPSQDLAKLVLGYLAEEQLMTAYDEFLQASPYLDAMHNEYDRIFMTSLKNILAEYRAVRIYVETCKPFLLRKKLFQCVNILEIIKFLVNNIDVNKIYAQDIGEKNSFDKQNASIKHVQCEVCSSLKLANCVCKSKQNNQNTLNTENVSQVEESVLPNSIETTALADLPGNHGKKTGRKKQVKKLNKNNTLLQCNINNVHHGESAMQAVSCPNKCSIPLPNNNISGQINNTNSSLTNCDVQPTCVKGPNPNIKVCSNNIQIVTKISGTHANVLENKGISSAITFQDFASGVTAGCDNRSATVPDSSTSETTNFQTPIINNETRKQRMTPTSQIVFKIDPLHNKMQLHGSASIATVTKSYTKIMPKTDEQRVKILSDIKVDKVVNANERRIIPIIKNATSTPLMQMKTMVINGTPAYMPHPFNTSQQNFTKDEIMAMPTIIIVPSSNPSQSSTCTQFSSTTSQSSNVTSVPSKPPNRVLSPLVLDVSPSTGEEITENDESIKVELTAETKVGLVKTVDIDAQHKITSVPKDCITSCTAQTSTPMVLPPLRKSSSTPRRTSHVRVLDFTTPRRVLHETIMEHNAELAKLVEVDVSTDANITSSEKTEISTNENIKKNENVTNATVKPLKDNTEPVVINKKSNWDADLRAMIANEDALLNPKKTTRLKSNKKKKGSTKNSADKDVTSDKKNKGRKSKKRLEEEDEPDINIKSDAVPVKPTINIRPAADRGPPSNNIKNEINNTQQHQIENKEVKNNEEERIDTPEVERLALQNAIGAKLNISDLLETPYKQVFYDIQMETPRCLGPDMLDEPMSDIKIMNIPTPRFFDSPKIVQPTPSSYSSRPTDYSSGGSYYKPDDQDYLPIPEIRCPVTSSKGESKVELLKDVTNDKKTTRPVRKCAKNVSYYAGHKAKDGEDKTEVFSALNESVNSNISHDPDIYKDKTLKKSKTHESSKVERSKKSSRKKKSPAVKEKPKTFMKIKPRRMTPTKETLSGKPRKRSMQGNSPKLARKRTTSKDKNINITPMVNSIPTKSRRKSSTPRKLHCGKTFNSESSGHNSPDLLSDIKQQNVTRDMNSINIQDSDTEQLNLRWSDDGSQDFKIKEVQKNVSESEDISQIQEYIKTTVTGEPTKEINSVLQNNLVKRGFDEVTAKIIERDLLDTPPHNVFQQAAKENILEADKTKEENAAEKSFDTDSSFTNELHIVANNTDDEDEIELSVHENNENTSNWCQLIYSDADTKDRAQNLLVKLKDTFSMEVCIEDGIAIRLRATPYNSLFGLYVDQDQTIWDKETRAAVESISNIDKLYTPCKETIRAQCYEIFDSTLNSLDTPVKVNSPKRNDREITVTEIVLDDELSENNEKTESKKRKRLQNSNGSDEALNESKKTKPDAQYLLASANIQNMDIESVLTQLHGP